jgi:hypothetical protein
MDGLRERVCLDKFLLVGVVLGGRVVFWMRSSGVLGEIELVINGVPDNLIEGKFVIKKKTIVF